MAEKGNLRVAVVQMQQAQGEVSTNIDHLKSLLRAHLSEPVDLLLLPEMWTTGFMTKAGSMSTADIADAYERGNEEMKSIAAHYGCAVYGSLIEPVEGDRLANSGLFVRPDGETTVYRKRHLFGPGGERKYFEGGSERVQVAWRGWQIRLSICYDLRFPIWQRQEVDEERQYDLLLNCANWPDVRIDAWEILLRARAVENQCYVMAANRTGDGPKGLKYPGYSMIIDALGRDIAEGKGGNEAILLATLDGSALVDFREKFPVLREIDDYNLTTLADK